ncbi:MAG: isoprenylcysteine carboxylmethyltransferase family protein [Thermoplasmata archaeon]|jgi:protein-S-isoprenylcysteine O-methyltransferase Ste14
MLSLTFVQICAGIALAATFAGFIVGRLRLPASTGPIRIVAKRPPARGTQLVWVLRTLVAVFWPVGVFIVPVYAYHWPATTDFPGSWVVQIFGVVLGASGGILYSRAARALGRQMTPAIQVQKDHQLLQTGPYRSIRHPVYTAIISIALGQTLFFLSPPLALVTVLLAGLAWYRARLEETLLASPAAFGKTYEVYMARTGRFLPRLHAPSPAAP